MSKYDEIQSLIGKEVTAIGCCGIGKDKEVSGVLSNDGYSWIVMVTQNHNGNDFEMPYSVYYQTINGNTSNIGKPIDKVIEDKKSLTERISAGLDRELERQKKSGKKFITDEEIDELIDRIIKEELQNK